MTKIRKETTKKIKIECYYNEATARIKKSADVIVNRMLIEIESGGNVRFEEGSPTDIWFSSCPDLVLSRFCASDYKDHNVSGIKIHRIIRIHNRMLRTWFDDILSSIVDDPDGEYYPCNRNTGYRKLLEYLFWMQDPQLSNGANEQGHLLEEGFLEAQTYSDLGRDGAVSLSNSLSLADRHRIEHLTKNGKNSDYSDSCPFRYGQLVISKVYLGKSVKALDDRQISKSSYPKIDAVFKPRKMCISIEGDTLCECSARQCEWYLFDNRLVLPEYVVEFEYVTKIERLRALLQDPEVTKINFASFDDLPLPLDPNIKVNGICVEKATLLKWRGLEAERYQTALDQRANALNSRKKLENDIKDLRQQAELAVFVKEDAVIQFKHVQVQMNDNQTELDEMQASMKDIERKLENYKADVLKLQEDLPASDRRNPEAERDELYIFTLFTSLSFGGVILMLKFKTMQNL
ncbi:leucine-rich repeat-containing protein 9-like [Mytilus trossulus]|uniref:leucine-rich repeat-containing protein 9-like n=1 Tax=Mytilus trossulus TaxID=6551 RepID=UPI0030058F0E